MKLFHITLLGLIFLFSGSVAGQEMHGFELQDGRYLWSGRFMDQNTLATDLQNDLLDRLSANPYIKNVRESRAGGIVGSVEGMPEAIPSTGMMVFSFGFSIECQDGEYLVTTRDWSGKSTNAVMSGIVLTLEDLLTGPLVGKRRKENFFKAHEEAQVRIFQLE